MKVELLYFDGCPNYERLLPKLRETLARAGVSDEVELRRVTSIEDAERDRFLGSPTVRIDGRDVDPMAGERSDYRIKCRLYKLSGASTGLPPVSWIAAAIEDARRRTLREPLADRGRGAAAVTTGASSEANDTVVDLIPFVFVRDVERSIAFYEALGFRLMKTHAPVGTHEFAELEATAAAKLMLARVDHVPERDPERASPGFLYLYTHSLDALRRRLVAHGFEPGEITDGSPGPEREMCVVDPDGHRHMVTELSLSSIASAPRER
jgi:catechol 2,3-dioxygenase-like lactoylglutathione lyase family enzyme